VGQGDGVLVQSGGENYLLDAGKASLARRPRHHPPANYADSAPDAARPPRR
jgi:hypothetical protein